MKAQPGNKSILVVEDERIIARDLKFTLEELGYQVPGIIDSGEGAIQKVSDFRPDLVLMDIHLKGLMNGIEAAQVITKQFETPVVFLTAHFDEDSLARAKKTYPLGYIIKPFDRRELSITIEVALHKYEVDKKIQHEAQWFETLLKSIGDGVIATDVDGYITLLNPIAEKLTGWTTGEAAGLNSNKVFNIINEHSRKPVHSPIEKVLETHKVHLLPESTLLVSKDGTEIPIEDSAAPIFSSKESLNGEIRNNFLIGSVLVFRDITQKKETAKKLTRQAFYDSLTNLPNRAWFRERLADALERYKRQPEFPFTVVMLDLDRFKQINDGMGHDVGDQLLAAVGVRLSTACRSIDTVARLGGDEFIILLENVHNEAEVLKIVRRVQTEISVPYSFNGQEVFTTASIGIVSCFLAHENYDTIDDLIRDADIAMYQAKANGRGCYQLFDQIMRQQVISMSQIESDLRRVLERRELSVYYQPIYCIETKKLEGFEALVRWNHPSRGVISPVDFLSIADDIGMGIQIDRWVLETATLQILDWQNKFQNFPNLKLNTNLSGKHFVQSEPLKWVAQVLSESEFPSNQLNLEITENLLIENTESAIAVLQEMKELGVLISIDDFGTGYSSLSYLQRFPIDTIKIDRSFVEGMGRQDHDSLEIVRAIILLGQVLKIKTVAEGIETREQLEMLQELNCDCAQGYYFSRPLSRDDMEAFLKSLD
jgi:diguanylate cyclase (GGDEF)-like protein/PAS domain S-box-containing protein